MSCIVFLLCRLAVAFYLELNIDEANTQHANTQVSSLIFRSFCLASLLAHITHFLFLSSFLIHYFRCCESNIGFSEEPEEGS